MVRLAALLLPSLTLAASLGAADVADVAEQLKELKAAYKAKESSTAIRIFDQLVQGFEALAPKEQDEVVRTVEQAYASRRDEGEDVEQLFIGASATLANMGPSGEKALTRALAIKHLKGKPMVLATIVEGIGQQKNPAMVDTLIGYLAPEKQLGVHAPVVAAAIRALACYRDGEPRLRKRIVEKLVPLYAELAAKAAAERKNAVPNVEIESAFQQIETPLLGTLRALTGAQFENDGDWSKWWQTAKDQDWSVAEPPAKQKEGGA